MFSFEKDVFQPSALEQYTRARYYKFELLKNRDQLIKDDLLARNEHGAHWAYIPAHHRVGSDVFSDLYLKWMPFFEFMHYKKYGDDQMTSPEGLLNPIDNPHYLQFQEQVPPKYLQDRVCDVLRGDLAEFGEEKEHFFTGYLNDKLGRKVTPQDIEQFRARALVLPPPDAIDFAYAGEIGKARSIALVAPVKRYWEEAKQRYRVDTREGLTAICAAEFPDIRPYLKF